MNPKDCSDVLIAPQWRPHEARGLAMMKPAEMRFRWTPSLCHFCVLLCVSEEGSSAVISVLKVR